MSARHGAQQLARAVREGRNVGAALRHLSAHPEDPHAKTLAEALARFLVARCESNHAGWRALRRVVVDSAAEVPWERCARRAVPHTADDLLELASRGGRTPLAVAQHAAARRRAEQIADHVEPAALLRSLGLQRRPVDRDDWRIAFSAAVEARSREQVERAIVGSLRT